MWKEIRDMIEATFYPMSTGHVATIRKWLEEDGFNHARRHVLSKLAVTSSQIGRATIMMDKEPNGITQLNDDTKEAVKLRNFLEVLDSLRTEEHFVEAKVTVTNP